MGPISKQGIILIIMMLQKRKVDTWRQNHLSYFAAFTLATIFNLTHTKKLIERLNLIWLACNLINGRDHCSNQFLLTHCDTMFFPWTAGEVPNYARPTTSSQQRFRKTPPLTDYQDEEGTLWTFQTQTLSVERTDRDMSPPQTVSLTCW